MRINLEIFNESGLEMLVSFIEHVLKVPEAIVHEDDFIVGGFYSMKYQKATGEIKTYICKILSTDATHIHVENLVGYDKHDNKRNLCKDRVIKSSLLTPEMVDNIS